MAKEQRLIDANNLMEQVKHIHNAVNTSEINIDYDTGFHSATSQVQGLIAYMPTVDAEEVVYGEWLDGSAVHNGKEVYQSIDCSVCEEVFKIESHDREYWKKRFKRCFCCGAVMDGGCCDG